MAETEDLKSFQCRFEADWGHTVSTFPIDVNANTLLR